ncbi:DUF6181 family protein [Streptomyces sp. NPDC051561]|uniref:DUF6181 family protein n=1 Tax=Streptomyces sp. NPDC051561 TaxID=3365658 RepID=UPI00379F888D
MPLHENENTPVRIPAKRGAARTCTDGVARIAIPLQPLLSAPELARVLLCEPENVDLDALGPVDIRHRIAEHLTAHGYTALGRVAFQPADPRHEAARRAIRRAYGPRFADDPVQGQFLSTPLIQNLTQLANAGDEQ